MFIDIQVWLLNREVKSLLWAKAIIYRLLSAVGISFSNCIWVDMLMVALKSFLFAHYAFVE